MHGILHAPLLFSVSSRMSFQCFCQRLDLHKNIYVRLVQDIPDREIAVLLLIQYPVNVNAVIASFRSFTAQVSKQSHTEGGYTADVTVITVTPGERGVPAKEKLRLLLVLCAQCLIYRPRTVSNVFLRARIGVWCPGLRGIVRAVTY